MSHQYNEVEVKILVENLQAVAKKLTQIGAKLVTKRTHEYNIRYENAENTLTQDKIVLRLRADNGVRLTYKEPLNPEAIARGVHSRFEAEVTVSDFDAMNTILTRLGFHGSMIYEKYRTTYELDGAEIVLDEMPYGNFVEIEGTEDQINGLLERLDLNDMPRISHSYAQLFEQVKSKLNLSFNDLTFQNFEGIAVSSDTLTD